MSERTTGLERDARAALLSETLVGPRPDLEVLATEVEFDGCLRVDLVGADTCGRLFALFWIEQADDAAVLRIVDALAWTRRNAAMLATHLGCPTIDVDAPPLAIAVGTNAASELLDRLGSALGPALEVYELCSVRSSRGSLHSLRALGTPAAGAAVARELPELTEEAFAGTLHAQQRERFRELASKLRRIDERIKFTASARDASWLFVGEHLARLRVRDGAAVFRAGADGPDRSLADGDALAGAVEDVLTVYVGRISASDDADGRPPEHAERPVTRTREALERYGAAGPALTPEEIAAFRD